MIEIKKRGEVEALFERANEPTALFNPTLFLFRKKIIIENHIKFLRIRKFLLLNLSNIYRMILKQKKKYLYKNNKLLGREIRGTFK